MATTRAVGVDLGTAFTRAAWLDPHGRSTLLADVDGDRRQPSAVLVADGEILVGKSALKRATIYHDRLAQLSLTRNGWAHRSTGIAASRLPIEVVLACTLRQVAKNLAEAGVTRDTATVIAVPCGMSIGARRGLLDAAQLAGLELLDLVSDTTAAALAWREQQLRLVGADGLQQTKRLLLCDLGASHLSAALVDIQRKGVRVLATDGDLSVGGALWSEQLLEHVAARQTERSGRDSHLDAAGRRRLIQAVDEAKHTLSVRQRALLEFDDQSEPWPITRDEFDQLTVDATLRVARLVGDLVRTSGVTWRQVDHLVLLGGASRMPAVGAMLQRISGLEPQQLVAGDEAVARGAALAAGWMLAGRGERGFDVDYHLVDITTHGLGVRALERHSRRPQHSVLMPRHTPLPTTVARDYVTSLPHQRAIDLWILEGDSQEPAECASIGHLAMAQLPAHLMAGWPVNLTFEMSGTGKLRVRAALEGVDARAAVDLSRSGRLSEDWHAQWKRLLAEPADFDQWLALADQSTRPQELDPEAIGSGGEIVEAGQPAAPNTEGLPSTQRMEGSWAELLTGERTQAVGESTDPLDDNIELRRWSQPVEQQGKVDAGDTLRERMRNHPRTSRFVTLAVCVVVVALLLAAVWWAWRP